METVVTEANFNCFGENKKGTNFFQVCYALQNQNLEGDLHQATAEELN